MCSNNRITGLIVGAVDHMLAAGVKQTEPESTKIIHDTQRPHSLMWAGSASMQGDLLNDYYAALKASPKKYLTVKESVDLYCSCYGAIRARRAEGVVLEPFHLDTATLISRQAKMDSSIVSELMQHLVNYNLPDEDSIQAIIAGHDPDYSSHVM